MIDDKITAEKIWFAVPSRKPIELSSGHIFAPGAVVGIGPYECDIGDTVDYFMIYTAGQAIELHIACLDCRSESAFEAAAATHRALYAEAKRKLLGVE
jgi:hypothetical protein